jgi:hypothetical protein
MTSRQLTLFALACFVLAIPLSHSAISAKKKAAKKKEAPAKVALCHFSGDNPVGHVIEVSSNAVAAHVEKHGDCTEFEARPDGRCRCSTCEELCTAAFDRCVAGCRDTDPFCREDCIAANNLCNSACPPLPSP